MERFPALNPSKTHKTQAACHALPNPLTRCLLNNYNHASIRFHVDIYFANTGQIPQLLRSVPFLTFNRSPLPQRFSSAASSVILLCWTWNSRPDQIVSPFGEITKSTKILQVEFYRWVQVLVFLCFFRLRPFFYVSCTQILQVLLGREMTQTKVRKCL